MRRIFIILLALVLVVGCCSCTEQPQNPQTTPNTEQEEYVMATITNPIAPKGNDPWVIYHEEDGYYYYCYSGKGGICVARMRNFYDLAKIWPEKV